MSVPGVLMLQALLGMSQSSCTLTEAESLGTEVLRVATFTEDLSVSISEGGGLESFAALGTAKAAFMPRIASTDNLFRCVHSFPTSRTHI